MKNEVLNEIEKELNWKEKIIEKIFKNYTYKILGIGEKRIFNEINF